MDVAATARQLGVSERTIRRWLRDGRLSGYRVGGRIRIPASSLREARAPYRTDVEAPPSGENLDHDPRGEPPYLLRRRQEAARIMDDIRARSKPPAGPDDTAEAYVRYIRDTGDGRWDVDDSSS